MATDDDNFLDGPVPAPETEATATERAHAKTFAELVDKTLEGRTPPAMTADDRALLEVATVIRAASGNAELAAASRQSIVEDALRRAIGGTAVTTQPSVVPISRGRVRRWIGGVGLARGLAVTSSLVAAAAIVLWLRAPHSRPVPVAAAPVLPETWTSRPADALIGPIAREQAGDASNRIDTIFADRLDGYRELRLRGSKP